MRKEERGITILTLVIGIIIMIILVQIGINLLAGEDGVIKSTIEERKNFEIKQYQEQIDIASVKVHLKDWKEEKTAEELLNDVQEDLIKGGNFKGSKYHQQPYQEQRALIITTKEGYIFRVNEEEVRYIGTEEEIKNIPEVQEGDIQIAISPISWTNGNVETTITIKNESLKNYRIDYSMNLSDWNRYTKPFHVEKNTVIYARLTNEIASGTTYATFAITNIDKVPASLTLSKSAVTYNSFTLSGAFNDANSGLSKIVWYYKRPQDNSWQSLTDTYTTMNGTTAGITGNVNKTKTITLSKGGTVKAYAVAYDVAGNQTASYSSTSPLSFETSKYTISYNANGGTGAPNSQIKYYGVNLTLSSTKPNRTGYTFQGWSTSSTATTASYNAGGTYSGNGTQTLYAVWKDTTVPTISLTASTTGWTNQNVTLTGKSCDTQTGIVGYAWTTTASTPSSWTSITKTTAEIIQTTSLSTNGTRYFWTKDEAGNINSASITITKIDKIKGNFALAKSAVSYNSFTLSGAFNDADSGLSKIVWYYKRPEDSSWQSYTSLYTTMNGTTAGITGNVNKTKTITLSKGGTVKAYAVAYDVAGNQTASYSSTSPLSFETSKYTISYNANGGTGAPNSQTKYHGVDLTLSSTKPKRTGYTFQGWSTSSTVTTPSHSAGGTYSGNATKTLYAVWKANTYTLTINPNGGTLNDDDTKNGWVTSSINKTFIYGQSKSFATVMHPFQNDAHIALDSSGSNHTIWYRAGYVFSGWKVTAGSGTVTEKADYNCGQSYDKTWTYDGSYAGNVTITAQWVPAVAKIGEVHYTSIASAIAAIPTSGTITMVNSTTESPTIPEGKTITLALNGKQINGRITNRGTLTLTGEGILSSGMIAPQHALYNYGTATIVGIRVTASSTTVPCITNLGGTLNVNSGSIEATQQAIYTYGGGTTNIKGGHIFSTSLDKATLSDDKTGKINISGGTIESLGAYQTLNIQGTCTITGGTIKSHSGSNATISSMPGSIVTITGGRIENTFPFRVIKCDGRVTLNGGIIHGGDKNTPTVLINTGGSFVFEKGTITNPKGGKGRSDKTWTGTKTKK